MRGRTAAASALRHQLLMIVMLVSIVLFSVVKFDSLVYNFLVRIALIPIVAGVSYESFAFS